MSRAHRLATAAIVVMLALVAIAEHHAGRTAFCRCGRVRLWAGAVHGPENSQQLADWYSLSHVVHGLLLYGALWWVARAWRPCWRLVVAVAIEATWEIAENSALVIDRYRAATIAWGYAGDSILNSLGDIGFMMLGFALASRLPARGAVALGIALELVALAAIRDDLTLNVLMLVHPVDAIRVWQAAE